MIGYLDDGIPTPFPVQYAAIDRASELLFQVLTVFGETGEYLLLDGMSPAQQPTGPMLNRGSDGKIEICDHFQTILGRSAQIRFAADHDPRQFHLWQSKYF